jgi:hypothetical protein
MFAEEPVAQAFGEDWQAALTCCRSQVGSGPSKAIKNDAEDADRCQRGGEQVWLVHRVTSEAMVALSREEQAFQALGREFCVNDVAGVGRGGKDEVMNSLRSPRV